MTVKISALPEVLTAQVTDILPIVRPSLGTTGSKKITVGNIFAAFLALSNVFSAQQTFNAGVDIASGYGVKIANTNRLAGTATVTNLYSGTSSLNFYSADGLTLFGSFSNSTGALALNAGISATTVTASGTVSVPIYTGFSLNGQNSGTYELHIGNTPSVPVRLVTASDVSTKRNFEVGNYTGDTRAGAWNALFIVEGATGNTTVGGSLAISNATAATSPTAAALTVAGGIGANALSWLNGIVITGVTPGNPSPGQVLIGGEWIKAYSGITCGYGIPSHGAIFTALGVGGVTVYNATDTRPAGVNTPRVVQRLYAEGTSTFSYGCAWDFVIGKDGAPAANGTDRQTNVLYIRARTNADALASYTDALTITGSGNITAAGGLTANGGIISQAAAAANATIQIKVVTSGMSRSLDFLDTAGSKYNWRIGAQINIDQEFEITPSTVVGGSTFSTPALRISPTGVITTAGGIVSNNYLQSYSATAALYLDRTSASNASIIYLRDITNTAYNWIFAAQYNINNGWEITPSTTVGGSTYSLTNSAIRCSFTGSTVSMALLGAGIETGILIVTGANTPSDPGPNEVKIGNGTLKVALDMKATTVITEYLRVNAAVPATSSSTGTIGEIRTNASYIYVCTATNTWKRAALTTF